SRRCPKRSARDARAEGDRTERSTRSLCGKEPLTERGQKDEQQQGGQDRGEEPDCAPYPVSVRREVARDRRVGVFFLWQVQHGQRADYCAHHGEDPAQRRKPFESAFHLW